MFPIHNSYYLSRLIFSSNSKTPTSRILIGKEAHSAEEYETHVAPYLGRAWPNAVLRFSVHDENPHKAPNSGLSASSTATVSFNADDAATTTASVSGDTSVTSVASSTTVVPLTTEQDRFKRFTERKLVVERLREKMANRPRPDFMDFMTAESSGSSTRPLALPIVRGSFDIQRDDQEKSSRPLPIVPNDASNENDISANKASPPQSVAINEFQSLGSHPSRSRLPAFLEARPRSFVSTSSDRSAPTSLRAMTPLVVPPPPIIFSTTSKSSSPVDVQMTSPKESRLGASSAQTAHNPLPAQSVNAQSFKRDLEEIKEMLVDMRGEFKKLSSASSSPLAMPPVIPPPPRSFATATPISTLLPYEYSPPQPPTHSYNPSYMIPPPSSSTTEDMFKKGEELRNATRQSLDRLASSTKAMIQSHDHIICDGCEYRGIRGVRFKCLDCAGECIER